MMRRVKKYLALIKARHQAYASADEIKYFCVGRNKTGTSSLMKAFEDLGFIVGNQRAAELLTDRYYFFEKFDPIIEFCKSAQVFQDIPFSYPETFKHLDRAFPNSKFILSIRNDAEQWYRSITKFHAKMFGNGSIPTSEDLLNATYIRKGFMYNTIKIHGTPEDDPYNKEIMIAHYNRYNQSVIDYFKDRPNDLLVLNLAEKGAYQYFIDYIGMQSPFPDFPWENKT
ncbi:MAG: hypothetical protein KJO81_01075 [Gammaproteobacteria bacterium]|nr:hypothetical protein [Gammaproteobacteria bacterium]